MNRSTSAMLAVALLCVFCGRLAAQAKEPAKGDRWKDARWRKVSQGDRFGKTDAERLGRNKVLITNEAYKQIFSAYLGAELPLFITSDSLLNGYHVLFEESVLRLEKANARKLPEVLRFIHERLPQAGSRIRGREKLVLAARRRAQIVVGVALRLAGDDAIKPEAELGRLIDAEVKRVSAAAGTGKPDWLGPPDDDFVALDYTRYRPRGFYTRSDRLKRYFRAVSWLQSIPFRVKKDEELLSMLLLGSCLEYRHAKKDPAGYERCARFFHCYRGFLGSPDDWDILAARNGGSEVLGAKIGDQVRFAPSDPSKAALPAFRILSAYRTPDAVLFQRTTDLRRFKRRMFPSGLEVTALLGSKFARGKLTGNERDKVLETIDAAGPLLRAESLYTTYLDALGALLDAPEPDAPKFMSGEPWQAKSCQTVLAGWAQLRHTWALQAKQSAYYLGLTRQPPGFVEPDPEFYARFGRLVRASEKLLKEAGALETDYAELAADLRRSVDIFAKLDLTAKGDPGFNKLSNEEKRIVQRCSMILMMVMPAGAPDDRAKAMKAGIARLKQVADDLEKGKTPDVPHFREMLAEMEVSLEALWRELHDVCGRLESLAHKQLRGVPFNDAENAFIRGYGAVLARIMLYGGNSYLTPKDDAPRIVDVFSNPQTRQYLNVGVARARAIYVLYPVKGGEVVCRGAVMPYYEFRHPKRLTDAEWKTLLDSSERPPIPPWVKSIVASRGIKVPDLKEDH